MVPQPRRKIAKVCGVGIKVLQKVYCNDTVVVVPVPRPHSTVYGRHPSRVFWSGPVGSSDLRVASADADPYNGKSRRIMHISLGMHLGRLMWLLHDVNPTRTSKPCFSLMPSTSPFRVHSTHEALAKEEEEGLDDRSGFDNSTGDDDLEVPEIVDEEAACVWLFISPHKVQHGSKQSQRRCRELHQSLTSSILNQKLTSAQIELAAAAIENSYLKLRDTPHHDVSDFVSVWPLGDSGSAECVADREKHFPVAEVSDSDGHRKGVSYTAADIGEIHNKGEIDIPYPTQEQRWRLPHQGRDLPKRQGRYAKRLPQRPRQGESSDNPC